MPSSRLRAGCAVSSSRAGGPTADGPPHCLQISNLMKQALSREVGYAPRLGRLCAVAERHQNNWRTT
eukprot:356061-Chlamydomonas_euryale.AAC.4